MSRFTGIKLLAFVAVCATFTFYLAFTIGNIRPSHLWFLHRDYTLSANFDDVTGLNTGDSVKVAGVIVGKVTEIKVVDGPNNGTGRARVTFAVHKTVRVPKNTEASIRWRNLLGQRYLYLNPPDTAHTDPTVLRPGDHIANTISVVDIGELFNRLGPIVNVLDPGQVNQFIDAVSGALSGNEQNLSQALDNLATVTASLATHDDAIGRLVGNVNAVAATVSNRDVEIKTVLDNLVAISTTFSANTKIVDDAVTNLGLVSQNLDRLLSNNRAQIDRILTNVNTVLNVVVGRLPSINAVLSGFPNASQKLLALGNVGQFLALIAPCLSIQVLPGVDASIPCNTPLNNPLTSAATQAPGGQLPAAAAAAAARPGAASPGPSGPVTTTTAPVTGGPGATTGISDLMGALANAGQSPAGP